MSSDDGLPGYCIYMDECLCLESPKLMQNSANIWGSYASKNILKSTPEFRSQSIHFHLLHLCLCSIVKSFLFSVLDKLNAIFTLNK